MLRSFYFTIISIVFFAETTSAELYKPEEFFTEPYLELLNLIKDRSLPDLKLFIEQNKIDLNKEFNVSWNVDLKKAHQMSRYERWKADKIYHPVHSNSGYRPETITLVNFLIINNNIEALRKLLKLGADPEKSTKWYGNGYGFAVEFNKVEAFDVLLNEKPFSDIKPNNRYFVHLLFGTETVKHWFSETDYVLGFPELLDVAYKHQIDFNQEYPPFGYPILDLSLNGLEKVIWLIQHNADLSVIDEYGDSLPLSVERWLASQEKDPKRSKLRIKKLLRIKELLIQRGVTFPPPTKEENLAKRRAEGRVVREPIKKDSGQ